jgi:DNA (cytosine-5)-methyltransferase 1
MKSPHSFTHIDIFAGCGGISLGLYKAGWKGLFAIEKSKMAFETLRYNLINNKDHFDWLKWLPVSEHDIVDVLKRYRRELRELEGNVDLVAGGPPCQGFSIVGRRYEQDQRNSLVNSYIEFINLVRPRSLFLENVTGFTIGFRNGDSRGEAYSNRVSRELQNMGYKVKDSLIDFSNFGVPQRRKRYILVGLSDGHPEIFFENIIKIRENFLRNKGIEKNVNLGEAISDLERSHGEVVSTEFKSFKNGVYGKPESAYQKLMREGLDKGAPDSHRFVNHKKKTIERFEYILENCQKNKSLRHEIKAKFGLKKKTIIPLDRNTTCPTLTTLPDDYIHYSEPRILTVREYARIQTFYDWFEIKNKYTTGGNQRKEEVPRYTQLGNAVPPLFAELSGIVLKTMIQNA